MTVVIGWAGVDTRGPTSLYLASDSRITWSNGQPWDGGTKLFITTQKPHILGFYGDVTFPSSFLAQLVQQIDNGFLFTDNTDPSICFQRIVERLNGSLLNYPHSISFGILHGMRHGQLMESTFHLSAASFTNRIAKIEPVTAIGKESNVLIAVGSGARAFNAAFSKWNRSEVKGTSRAVFSALSDAIRSGTDPHTGGPPQLVGLHRKGPARPFGVIWDQRRWMLGGEVPDDHGNLRATNWHNDLFELVDPVALSRDKMAQPQPRPRSLQRPG